MICPQAIIHFQKKRFTTNENETFLILTITILYVKKKVSKQGYVLIHSSKNLVKFNLKQIHNFIDIVKTSHSN